MCVCLCYISEEAPEEVYDPRSLFERLQEQKDKKQEEYEEQFKFSKTLVHSVGPYPCPFRVKTCVYVCL